MNNILSFSLATSSEICKELGARLRAQRLLQDIQQSELAAKAGVSRGTVQNLERKGQCSLESLIRIVISLGLADDLEGLFQLKPRSIAQMEKAEQSLRPRASRRRR
jgi:transcriptional regulator with XRE-family HTH domain